MNRVISGPISASDLDMRINTGRIYRLHGEDGEIGCAFLMPAEACTEVGHTEPRAKSYRTLIALCMASWLVPVALLSLVSFFN